MEARPSLLAPDPLPVAVAPGIELRAVPWLKRTSGQGVARGGPHVLRDCPGGLRVDGEWFPPCGIHARRSRIQVPSFTLQELMRKDFVLLRPSAGDPKPFHIATIAAKEALPDGRMAVRLVYYEHEEDNPKDSDPYTGCYEPSVAHFMKPLYSLPLLAVHGSAIQEQIKMIKARPGHGGGYRMQIGKCNTGLGLVRLRVRLNSSSLQELGAKRVREDAHRMVRKRKRLA